MPGHPWPLFDLRLRTPRLELRLPTDDDLLALIPVARAGIAPEGEPVFIVAWHELPSPAFERQFLLHWWTTRGAWKPSAWVLGLVAVRREDGQPIGIQDVTARDFAIRRTVLSGSWLGREYQGEGYGTEMRAAVLALAFDGLGADAAESGYIASKASARVSEKLGYEPNGEEILAVGGKRVVEQRLRLERAAWRRDAVPVTIEGLERCLSLFGATELGPDDWARL